MVAMNSRLFALLLCASLLAAVQARAKTILPDSCGDSSIKFDVTTKKNQPAPAPPEAGKAQIILIESGRGVARYGMDGAWLGANDGDSYFAVTVTPGEHHLCMSFQIPALAGGKIKQESVRMLAFTAEAGKVYYFEASSGAIGGSAGSTTYVQNTGGGTGGQYVHSGGSVGMPVFGFAQLDEDTGKYRIKAWKLATWQTNK
jgi:hypothetical protein